MLKVPIDLLQHYFVQYLDPRDFARLSGVSKRFRCFQDLVHDDYKKDADTALYQACKEGHRVLAEWLIDVQGATDINAALVCACKGGHRALAEWLIDVKGATYINDALGYACYAGHRGYACYAGHRELAE